MMFHLNDSWSAEGSEDKQLHQSLFGNGEAKVIAAVRKKRKKITSTGGGQVPVCAAGHEKEVNGLKMKEDLNDKDGTVGRKRKRKRGCEVGDSSQAPSMDDGTDQTQTSLKASQTVGGSSMNRDILKRKSKLRSKLSSKMEGAHFRWINEQLYTMTGNKALKLFKEDPELFQSYHKGFATQVSKWPSNPLDRVISYVNSLPSSLVIADFGCGEAELAKAVPHRVHSFDLVASNAYVTACDMAHVPLPKESIDVCVFCLSLMGTNVTDFIREARRVIKENGRMKICEIESRFESVDAFIKDVESIGFRVVKSETFNKMFVDFEFEPVPRKATKREKKTLPKIYLKPCIYKRR